MIDRAVDGTNKGSWDVVVRKETCEPLEMLKGMKGRACRIGSCGEIKDVSYLWTH